MKIMYFTKYSRKGASSRLRSYQYFPYFEKNGIEIEVYPLFDSGYLENLYQGKKVKKDILKAYLKRFVKLLSIKKNSKLVIEYELFPYLPAWFEHVLKLRGINYAVDYDDAVFHNYDLNNNRLIKWCLHDKIDKVMRYSSVVVAGNHYLEEKAKSSGAGEVHQIPTVVDTDRYPVKSEYNMDAGSKFIVGWIGTFSTFKYIKQILPVLEEVASEYPLVLHIVGAKGELGTSVETHFIPWTEDTEARSIRNFDVGIMPLDDTPWERGKCGYKLIQYMASGIPVIASGLGVNNEIVKQGINGFVANTLTEWRDVLLYFIHNRNRIPEMGKEGRKTVEKKYSLQITNTDWLKIMRNI